MSIKLITKTDLRTYSQNVQIPYNEQVGKSVKSVTNRFFKYALDFVNRVNSKTSSRKFIINFILNKPESADTEGSYATMLNTMVKSDSIELDADELYGEKVIFNIIINVTPLAFLRAFAWMYGPEFEHMKEDIHGFNAKSGSGFISIMWTLIHEMTHGINLHVDRNGQVYKAYEDYYKMLRTKYRTDQKMALVSYLKQIKSAFPDAFKKGLEQASRPEDIFQNVRRIMQSFSKFTLSRWYGWDEGRNSSLMVRALLEHEVNINATLFVLPVFILYMEILLDLRYKLRYDTKEYNDLVEFIEGYNEAHIDNPEKNATLYELVKRLVKKCAADYSRINAFATNFLANENAYEIIGDINNNIGSSYTLLITLIETIKNIKSGSNNLIDIIIDFISNDLAYGVYSIVKSGKHSALSYILKRSRWESQNTQDNPLFTKIGDTSKSIADYVRESILNDYRSFIDYHKSWSNHLNTEAKLYETAVEIIESYFNILNDVLANASLLNKARADQDSKDYVKAVDRIDSTMRSLDRKVSELYKINALVAFYTSLADEGYNIDLLKSAAIDKYQINADVFAIERNPKVTIDVSKTMGLAKSLLANIFVAILPKEDQDLAEIAAEKYVTAIYNSSNNDISSLGGNNINKRTSMFIIRAIKEKQDRLTIDDIIKYQQLSTMFNKLVASNILFTYIGKYEEDKLTGAASQLINFIKWYDNDAKYIVESMYKYVRTIVDLVVFEEKQSKSVNEGDDAIEKKFKDALSNDKNLLRHIKDRESSNYSITATNLYLSPAFVSICEFQSRYRKMLNDLFFKHDPSKGRERSPDYSYYEHLFYTNITDSLAIGIYLPSLFKVVPAFVNAIVSYKVVGCDENRIQSFYAFAKKLAEESKKQETEDDSKEFSNLNSPYDLPSGRSALRTLSYRETDHFDNLNLQPMKSREPVFRFAIVLGTTSSDITPSCKGREKQPPVGPEPQPPGGSGQGTEPQPPGGPGQGTEPQPPGGSGQGTEPQPPGGPGQGTEPQPPGGPGQGTEPQPPGGPGGGEQQRPNEKRGKSGGDQSEDDGLDESIEKDIDTIAKVIAQIGAGSSRETDTQQVKDLIGSILKKVGIDSNTDVDEAYTDLLKELGKAVAEIKNKGDESGTDILDDLSKVSQRIKDKLKDIIRRKKRDKNIEGKGKDNEKIVINRRGRNRDRDDETEYQDFFDPSLVVESILDDYKELIEKEIGKGGKGGLPEGLLVRAAFELSGLSGGALDLVFRLLARHIHQSTFEDRDKLGDSDIRNIEIDFQQIVSIFERPPLLPVLTEAMGDIIPTSTLDDRPVYYSVPSIVADYLSIDVSGSMHALIAEAVKAHQAAQSALQSTGKLSSNPALSRVTEFIIRYLARKIYEHGASSGQNDARDEKIREALDRIVKFINNFISISRSISSISDVANKTSSHMKELVKDTHEVLNYFMGDMSKEVVDNSEAGPITIAKLLNHLSSIIYMGIYANPIEFLSANKYGLREKKKYISVIHDGEVPIYDDEAYTYTITSTDNYPRGAITSDTVIFPSLTDSIDMYVSEYSNTENMVKLLDFISRIKLHARNLHGGNAPASEVGEFWARTLIKDIILSVAGNYSRGVKNTSMRLAFNVLHLTDTNYYANGGHVAGFVNYILEELYAHEDSGTPPYKRIIDSLLQVGSVHEVISGESATIDPKIAQTLQKIRDKIYMNTVAFENGGVAIMVNILDPEDKTGELPVYIYFIDFVDLVIYQFEESTFLSGYDDLFRSDTRNILSEVDFYKKFKELLDKYGYYEIGKSSKSEKLTDDIKLKRIFVQSAASIIPRSVKYYNINTASIALIYIFYSIVALAFVGSRLRSLVSIGSGGSQKRGIEPDYSEIDKIKLNLEQIRNDLEKYFLGHSGFSAIFSNILRSYTKMRIGKIRIGDIFGRSLDVYASLSEIGDVVEEWCKSNPNVSVEDIARILDGKALSEDVDGKHGATGHGLYNYTDANANDNPMGSIIPLIPTL